MGVLFRSWSSACSDLNFKRALVSSYMSAGAGLQMTTANAGDVCPTVCSIVVADVEMLLLEVLGLCVGLVAASCLSRPLPDYDGTVRLVCRLHASFCLGQLRAVAGCFPPQFPHLAGMC